MGLLRLLRPEILPAFICRYLVSYAGTSITPQPSVPRHSLTPLSRHWPSPRVIRRWNRLHN